MIDLTGSKTLTLYRFRWPEILPLIVASAAFLIFPNYLVFGASVMVMAMFAISLDLIIGFAGILTLGHGVFYGIGAYASGLVTFVGVHEPVTGALFGAAIAAVFAGISGPFILRLKGLPLIMVTLSVVLIVLEAANKASWLTGGHNGLQNIEIAPILGWFEWSLDGSASYLYVLTWLVIVFLAARVVVSSPFGVALQGIRENEGRMRVIGAPVLAQKVLAYVISAYFAGLAGALSTQTNAFVSLDVLNLDLSLYALAMLVLGGIGRLYGALIGAVVYMSVQYFTQEWNPSYWMFTIGFLLIFVVRFWRGGLLGLAGAALSRLSSRTAPT